MVVTQRRLRFYGSINSLLRTDKANDGDEIMQFMKKASVEEIMKRQDYWHTDLSEMIPMIEEYYELIQCKGIAGLMRLY